MMGNGDPDIRGSSALLTPDDMGRADALAIAAGTTGEALMRRAAAAIAATARSMAPAGAITVLAGPGNNGGDAYAAASLLRAEGRDVSLFAAVPVERMRGDAGTVAREWAGPTVPLSRFEPEGFALAVDGLLGAGLSREVEGAEADAIARLNASAVPALAIDLPSGLSGLDGQVRGIAVEATRTVTFFRRKPGHLLLPGRSLCGTVEVAEIGIGLGVLDAIGPTTFANEPSLFGGRLLRPRDIHHKYDRGHAVVFSGGAARTGAARLSAMAALRGGAGLVTLFSPPSALLVNAGHLTAIMLRRCADADELGEHLRDRRLAAFVLGPGFGDLDGARTYALAILAARRALVLDADGITAFAGEPQRLFEAVASARCQVVLTPHDGEFARLFPDIAKEPSKLGRARRAAERSGAVVVLKGSDTVIASPDGRAAINGNGPSNLATAGTGDVLAGLVAAQLANGVPAFEAAAAAVWLHAEAAAGFGPGLIAEDFPALLPKALGRLEAAC